MSLQEPVHVLKYPTWFSGALDTPPYHHQMYDSWSHDSTQLLVSWMDDDRRQMFAACLSRDALAEREVSLLLLLNRHSKLT